jgi:hypothetical protein
MRAASFGWYPTLEIALITLARVVAFTLSWLLITRDTVITPTCASRATSIIVGLRVRWLAPGLFMIGIPFRLSPFKDTGDHVDSHQK